MDAKQNEQLRQIVKIDDLRMSLFGATAAALLYASLGSSGWDFEDTLKKWLIRLLPVIWLMGYVVFLIKARRAAGLVSIAWYEFFTSIGVFYKRVLLDSEIDR